MWQETRKQFYKPSAATTGRSGWLRKITFVPDDEKSYKKYCKDGTTWSISRRSLSTWRGDLEGTHETSKHSEGVDSEGLTTLTRLIVQHITGNFGSKSWIRSLTMISCPRLFTISFRPRRRRLSGDIISDNFGVAVRPNQLQNSWLCQTILSDIKL